MELPKSHPNSRVRKTFITHDHLSKRGFEIMERLVTAVEDVTLSDSSMFDWSGEGDFRRGTFASRVCIIPSGHGGLSVTELAFSLSARGVTIDTAGRNPDRGSPPESVPWAVLGIPFDEIPDLVCEFQDIVRKSSGLPPEDHQLMRVRLGFPLDPKGRKVSIGELKSVRMTHGNYQTLMVNFPASCFLSELIALFSL